jgi:hypothetical protein
LGFLILDILSVRNSRFVGETPSRKGSEYDTVLDEFRYDKVFARVKSIRILSDCKLKSKRKNIRAIILILLNISQCVHRLLN